MITPAVGAGVTKVIEKSVGKSSGDIDVSLWGLIIHADFVVQIVMLILLAGSIISWAIITNKFREIRNLLEETDKFNKLFSNTQSFESLYERVFNNQTNPYERVFCVGMTEFKKLNRNFLEVKDREKNFLLQDHMNQAMRLYMEKEAKVLKKGLIFLATLASSAPFIGLFGTVWGIMSSFQSIAIHQNTNLAVVAPGIAEALFTTALGLFAAIPAVIFYNIFSQNIRDYLMDLESFIENFGNNILINLSISNSNSRK